MMRATTAFAALTLAGFGLAFYLVQSKPPATPTPAIDLSQKRESVGTRPGDVGLAPDIWKAARARGNELALLGAGCFWCIEDAYRRVPGVVATAVGYAGGTTEKPTYKEVCTGTTGHAEVNLIEFNPKKISYQEILDLFWLWHDPTQLNRQGPDVGTQYRSVIFTFGTDQARIARESLAREEKSKKHRFPIVTQIQSAPRFWMAEDYHQQYYIKNGMKNWKIDK